MAIATLYLFGPFGHDRALAFSFTMESKPVDKLALAFLNNNLAIVDRFFLTHAYLLSNHGAETLLRLHNKIEKQVDAFMSDYSKEIIILGLRKDLCFQNLKMKQ